MIDDALFTRYIQKLTILCVEDNAMTLRIYENIFEELFGKIVTAKDGLEGLELFKSEGIDIIITDYQMPRMSGIEFIKAVREIDNSVPIVLVSAIEETEVFMDALKYRVNSFIKKPFNVADVLDTLNDAVRLKIADIFLEKEMLQLNEHKKYSNYQEELSFQKELSIIQNDFYYKLSDQNMDERIYISDFLYQPLDIISGDCYSARQLHDGREFYFIVDGMGKGVSASVSAMLLTKQINALVDKSNAAKSQFDFKMILKESISYLQITLLEDEVVSLSAVLIDAKKMSLSYASYSMPSILLMHKDGSIQRLNSNNPPINKYMISANIETLEVRSASKLLIYSDGLNENSIKEENEIYSKYIEEDFKDAMTRHDFKKSIENRIGAQEDDITFIFLNQLSLGHKLNSLKIQASLSGVEEAGEWYEKQTQEYFSDEASMIGANIAFNELCMNAYEHGALSLSNQHKHQLIEDDAYFDYLNTEETKRDSKIKIELYKISAQNNSAYLLSYIEDEGSGFDTEILKNIFGFHKNFNGRGISMSRSNTLGIYYTNRANGVYFLNRL